MKQTLLTTAFLFVYLFSFGQEITFYDELFYPTKYNKKTPPPYYSIVEELATGRKEKFFLLSDSTLIKEKRINSHLEVKDYDEVTFYFDQEGDLIREILYNKEDSIRIIKVFNKEGKLIRRKHFLHSKTIFNAHYDENGDEIEKIAELQAEPYMGNNAWYRYLAQTLRYPKEARIASAKGNILVYFTVSELGEISNIEILNTEEIHFALAGEGYKALKNYPHDWNPYMLNGVPRESEVVIPIKYNEMIYR